MKASEMANEELAECIESARLAPAKYVREDGLNFHREAIREAAARLRNLGEIGEEVGLEATREKESRVGNAAKMREACENIAEYAKTAALHTDDLHLLGYLNQIERWSESVLSSPPRNCDVGTAEEQNRRFCKWCRKYGIDGDMEVACAHQDMSCTLCALRWAQMPYEEG